MHDALGVRGRQALRHLRGDLERAPQRQAALEHQLAQGPPLDQLHHDERHAVRLAHVVDDDDVRIVQGRRGARLALEAGQRQRVVGPLGGEHLEGHVAHQAHVARAVDLAHAALAEQ